MNPQVIIENMNQKMKHTGSPNEPRPALLRRLTTPTSITEERINLAAALTQPPYSSSLASSADRSGKALQALWLTLSINAMTCHLLVSTEARGPHRNS